MTAPLHVSVPAGKPRGGIVVVQEAFGVNQHIEDVCDRVAAAGYLAVAPVLFHRTGSAVVDYDDLEHARQHMKELRADEILADVDDGFARIGELPKGIVGFCMGGSVAFYTAVERQIAAAVTFYGGGIADGRFGFPSQLSVGPTLQTPWLGLYGDLDSGIPVEQVEQLRIAVSAAEVPAEIVRYPDADHGFHCDARPSVFDGPAAADAWERTLAFFARYVT